MKKFSLSVALVAALAFVGFAQAPATEGDNAEIYFEKTVHDFGAIPQKGKIGSLNVGAAAAGAPKGTRRLPGAYPQAGSRQD